VLRIEAEPEEKTHRSSGSRQTDKSIGTAVMKPLPTRPTNTKKPTVKDWRRTNNSYRKPAPPQDTTQSSPCEENTRLYDCT